MGHIFVSPDLAIRKVTVWAVLTNAAVIEDAAIEKPPQENEQEQQQEQEPETPETHMTHLKAFIAGFASTLVFHQGLLWLL